MFPLLQLLNCSTTTDLIDSPNSSNLLIPKIDSQEFAILLKEPVPQPKKHETQEWFHPHTTREQADNVLMNLSDGSFLVRVSEQDANAYAISFTYVARLHVNFALWPLDNKFSFMFPQSLSED